MAESKLGADLRKLVDDCKAKNWLAVAGDYAVVTQDVADEYGGFVGGAADNSAPKQCPPPAECDEHINCCTEALACCRAECAPKAVTPGQINLVAQFLLQALPALVSFLQALKQQGQPQQA